MSKGSVLKVVTMGHPGLRVISRPVDDPTHPDVQSLISDMQKTVDYLNCSGLAAPQVLAPLRIVLFRVVTSHPNPAYVLTPEHDPEGVPWTLMINPKVTPLSDDIQMGWETCLSLPGLMGKVPRHQSIEYSFTTPDGKHEKRTAHGFHARVVQHECDHLDGILYPQRMKDMGDLAFKEEVLANGML